MYDCTNIGLHFPVITQRTLAGGVGILAGDAGGIAFALHVEHPNNPQLHFQLYCSKARE
jgi:hypothetical protein